MFFKWRGQLELQGWINSFWIFSAFEDCKVVVDSDRFKGCLTCDSCDIVALNVDNTVFCGCWSYYDFVQSTSWLLSVKSKLFMSDTKFMGWAGMCVLFVNLDLSQVFWWYPLVFYYWSPYLNLKKLANLARSLTALFCSFSTFSILTSSILSFTIVSFRVALAGPRSSPPLTAGDAGEDSH